MKIKPVLYRNSQQGKLLGVCAGWAEFLHQDVGVIRTLTVIFALFPLTTFFTVMSYLVMGIVLEDKPQYAPVKQNLNKTSTELLDDIEASLTELETKVTGLENYVTSERFEFQCKLWALKKS